MSYDSRFIHDTQTPDGNVYLLQLTNESIDPNETSENENIYEFSLRILFIKKNSFSRRLIKSIRPYRLNIRCKLIFWNISFTSIWAKFPLLIRYTNVICSIISPFSCISLFIWSFFVSRFRYSYPLSLVYTQFYIVVWVTVSIQQSHVQYTQMVLNGTDNVLIIVVLVWCPTYYTYM